MCKVFRSLAIARFGVAMLDMGSAVAFILNLSMAEVTHSVQFTEGSRVATYFVRFLVANQHALQPSEPSLAR